VHLCPKVPFVFACFQASAAPRPKNPDSDEKYALFGFDTQITVLVCVLITLLKHQNSVLMKTIKILLLETFMFVMLAVPCNFC
jgi:hypothetical protein